MGDLRIAIEDVDIAVVGDDGDAPDPRAEGDGVRFFEATALDAAMVTAVQEAVREPVLELFEKEGLLEDQAAANMRRWSHGGGFSLDATRVTDRPE